MPIGYPGVDVPRTGLKISVGWRRPNGTQFNESQDGHGWLRLIVRPNRTPLLSFSAVSNREARPENCADFHFAIQHAIEDCPDLRLPHMDLQFPLVNDRSDWIRFWAKQFDTRRALKDLRFTITNRTENSAYIVLKVNLAESPDLHISIEGIVRAVAPDSILTRVAMASANNGWLALSNFSHWDVNGDWNLVDGDLDELPASPDVLAVDLEANTRLSDVGICPLARLPNLQIANLSRTGITGMGLKDFKNLARFHALNSNETPLTDQGLSFLAGRQLTVLSLNQTRVTDEGLRSLGPTPQLRSLHLAETTVTDDGLLALGPMPSLKDLYLTDTHVGDALVAQLLWLCPNLESLGFGRTAVTEASVAVLAALPKLTWISGGERHLGPTAAENLRRLRPNLSLV